MLDNITNQVFTILSTSICGVSLTTILGMIIYVIKLSVTNKKNLQITTKAIEDAFKEAVLPKTIKLDISNKIETPIKEGLIAIADKINGSLKQIEQGEQMMLKILTLFTHFQKLPENIRIEIEDFINKETASVEVKL